MKQKQPLKSWHVFERTGNNARNLQNAENKQRHLDRAERCTSTALRFRSSSICLYFFGFFSFRTCNSILIITGVRAVLLLIHELGTKRAALDFDQILRDRGSLRIGWMAAHRDDGVVGLRKDVVLESIDDPDLQ